MNPKIKTKIDEVKHFVEENSMLVACAASALIASKFTHTVTVRHCTEKVGAYVVESERDRGHLLLQNRVMLDFINQKELGQELKTYILSMRD